MRLRRAAGVTALTMSCAYGQSEPFRTEPVTTKVDSRLEARHVTSVNGLYDGCQLRHGSWSMRVAGNAPLTHAPLGVLAGDDACRLWLTDLIADERYTATPPLLLTRTGAATMFVAPSGRSITVDALHDQTAANGLGIELVETESRAPIPGGAAIFAAVRSPVVTTAIEPSDYTFTFGLEAPLTVEMDAKKVIVRATGSATLVPGIRAGEMYAVDDGTLGEGATEATVARAFLHEKAAGRAYPLGEADRDLPASAFRLEGATVGSPITRTVVITRSIHGVAAYQLIRITFGG